ncbi:MULTISPECIES: DUF4426 domain-containing protein [Salinivibrio]|jgi:hypothetical protein|uniref:DUF4426 domain-containing protein n=2 Tax=Salinivibrio TaxID=51366 RepID=A0ABY7LG46_9GAMM|nr:MULTISPECIES: DUF4426 domain-containing protein [Salinivibrio]ODP96057.1 hypothetical protein BGK46_15285 [Salinivibrio sp. DV]OOF08442.1 hypothetical protein BZG82_14405 [Salinivibrio sp. PR5]OOF14140.1 hypothetical protein BZG83_06525 [Salinivibrio sp. PR919]OOF18937.1 hypothetical protein BZG84_01685 [Salinivibrio sp. PR932]OOF20586.1 hypothetical protein BZJ17_12510 [Salinivibrio sp. IB574]
MRTFTVMLVSFLSLFSLSAWSGQYKEVGELEVHYNTISTTFLTPEIAKQYDITRSGYRGLVNIAVLDKMQLGKPAVSATLTGSVKNLVGNSRELDFKEIREGEAIYYIATFAADDEETYQFHIELNAQGNRSATLDYRYKFYVDTP